MKTLLAGFNQGIDFATFITERTRDFTGREWLEAEVESWLADPGAARFCLVTGDPGVGKSAFAAHWVRSRPDRIAAYHFCSARLGGWIDPLTFARSLAAQLALRLPDFQKALLAQEHVHIEATQTIGQLNGGQAVNVWIGNLEVSDAQAGFNRLIRDPLLRLAGSGWQEPVLILVDGLDEALACTGACTIVDLLARARDLPPFVRILLTSRSEQRVLRYWEDIPHLRIEAGGARNLADIRRYVDLRLRRVAEQEGRTGTAQEAVDRIVEKSAGNFLYVSYLMDTFERHPDTRTLEDLPDGLDGVYRLFLNSRDIGKDWQRWETRFLPVVGVLAVAREPLSEERLARFTSLDRQKVAAIVRDLWQYLSLEPGETPAYRIYHQSFLDFLTQQDRAQAHWVDTQHWHTKIVQAYYGSTPGPQPLPSEPDGYALRHLTTHLEAAGCTAALFHLVEDNDWYKRKLSLDGSGASYAADVERAIMAAARIESVVDLVAYCLLFATVTEPFTEALIDQLVQRVEKGQVREALETAYWIALPGHRAKALLAIGTALSKGGQREEAREVWRDALAVLRAEGNPVRASKVACGLCAELFKAGEENLAEETLNLCMLEIRSVPIDEQRFLLWGSLVEELLRLKNTRPSMRAIDVMIADAGSIRHLVRLHRGSDHEDPPYSYFDGVYEKRNAIELAVWLIQRVPEPVWCDEALLRLEQVVATIPTLEKWDGYEGVYELPPPPKDLPPDSQNRKNMRELIAKARRETIEPQAAKADGRPRIYYGYGSNEASGPDQSVGSKRLTALKRLENGQETKVPPTVRTPSERALARLVNAAGTLADRLHSFLKGSASNLDEMTLNLLVIVGACDDALRLVNGINIRNSHECAGWLLAITWRTAEPDFLGVEDILDRVVDFAARLQHTENKSRVLAGVACVLNERGLSARAWALIEAIESESIRIDAAIALLLALIARCDQVSAAKASEHFAAILGSTSANGELARGWLALLAWAVWVGNQNLREKYTAEIQRILNTEVRPEHTAFRSFLFEDGRYPHKLRGNWQPWGDAAHEERLRVENAFGILLAQGYGEKALGLFAQMSELIDTRLALKAMGSVALDSQNVNVYRQVLRLDAGRLALEYARPSWERYPCEEVTRMPATPCLPESLDREGARRWMETAFLAARFEGRNEVWRHVSEMAPLLAHFPDGTAQALHDRLLAIEKLHQEPTEQKAPR